MITNFKRIDGAASRGSLFQWSYNGSVVSAFWPAGYSNVVPDVDNAATALNAGILAAGNEIAAAADRLKKTDEIHGVALEAVSRFVAAPFRYLRDRAIADRDSVGMARASLRQPVERQSATPYSIAADSLERQEIRRTLDQFDQIGEAFDWVMKSTGLTVLNAIAPSIDLTIFAKDKQLADLVQEEFAIRKTARLIDNSPDDIFATASQPLRNKADYDQIRNTAKARVGDLKVRESAVSDAEKLLIAVIAFTSQTGNISADEAFRLLMGKSA
ncbi:hypothetical protein [Mesorhizobium sp.]|uniref:hypothetical protein n=1 Tax=Mesorhizobium sp. TaxID=1871066 RepID=UPI000FD223F1|nr:hypothetical protein [Mesorhizobium sp.]RVC63984.1 hypothetical protein EN779_03295 [Mesorhizobium sp. M4B.F.Ca.ET.088.02.2.1]RWF32439.1 MAG: hypothetical protein EOS45_06900 [Mesorhizobium sp.]